MGTHAERVAIKDHVSREDQDAFALASHRKAIAAIDAGRFDAELAPVTVRDAKGRETVVTVDEGPRRDTTAEALARLKPAFALPDGEDRGDATSARSRPATRPGSPTAPRPRSSPASAPSSGSASHRSPASSATPRPRSRPSGCSSRRSRASAGCSTGSSCRSRRSTSSRSTRRSRRRPSPTVASSASTGTRSTSTAARSRSATRSARAVPGSWRRCSTSCAAGRAATASRPCASGAAARWRWRSSGSDRRRYTRRHDRDRYAADPRPDRRPDVPPLHRRGVDRVHERPDVREPQPGRPARRHRAVPAGHRGRRGDGRQRRLGRPADVAAHARHPSAARSCMPSGRSWPSTRSGSRGR